MDGPIEPRFNTKCYEFICEIEIKIEWERETHFEGSENLPR